MKITKLRVTAAGILIAVSAYAGEISTDDLIVSNTATIYGNLRFYTITVGSPNGASATGGTITVDGNYRIHTFTSNGTFSVTGGSLSCEILAVGGGGGGGGNVNNYNGGGGAGGIVEATGVVYNVGDYAVVIGSGGGGGGLGGYGTNGGDSTISDVVAKGGGGGGYYVHHNGLNGGCGGGGVSFDEANCSTSGVTGVRLFDSRSFLIG